MGMMIATECSFIEIDFHAFWSFLLFHYKFLTTSIPSFWMYKTVRMYAKCKLMFGIIICSKVLICP